MYSRLRVGVRLVTTKYAPTHMCISRSFTKSKALCNSTIKFEDKAFKGSFGSRNASDMWFGFGAAAITGIAFASLFNSDDELAAQSQVSMRGLIPQFAKVQDALKSVGYKEANNFPQIVVIGVQSSGKSSVLENIVGEEFLPKGEGTVTKRPIVLTLHNTSDSGSVKYAELPEISNQKITDFRVLERKIAECNNKFTDTPLRVEIYSPHVVDLRLVDLPGIIHNPTVHQPQDMRERIKEMCKNYIENPNTVILCISPANSDLQTSEALRFCRKFDERGERTISVLTKLDLVEPGDVRNLTDTLRQLPLQLGYVGVKCRSKSELLSGLSIPDALQLEQEFFELNQQFKRAGIKTGTLQLAGQLSTMLQRQVERALPAIVDKVRNDLRDTRKQLSVLGGPPPKTEREKNEVLLLELSKFLKDFLGPTTLDNIKVDIAQSIYSAISDECQRQMPNFAKSYKEQNKRLQKLPANTPVFWEGQDDIKFLRWKENVDNLVERLAILSEGLTFRVVQLLREKIDPSSETLRNRPALQDAVKHLTMKYLNRGYEETVDHVKYLVSLEKNISYNSKTIEEKFNQVAKEDSSKGKEEKKATSWFKWGSGEGNPYQTESLKYGQLWTETYLQYLSERLATNIYNALCVEILDSLKENLQQSFTAELVGNAQKDELLREVSAVEQKRRELDAQIEELDKALNTLSTLVTKTK